MNDLSTILELLPSFMEKVLIYPVLTWGRQWSLEFRNKPSGKVQWDNYKNQKTSLKKEHLIDHFLAKPNYAPKHISSKQGGGVKNVVWGSYGCSLKFSQNLVKYIAYDADTPELTSLAINTVIPYLKDREIDYILEYSGSNDDKCHLWIPTSGVDIKYTNMLFEQIKQDLAADTWFTEQYPYGGRETAILRLPFGLYLKTMEVKWANWNGREIGCLRDGLKAFIEAKPVTQERIISLLKSKPIEKKIYKPPTKVLIESLAPELNIPNNIPKYVGDVAKRCPALNKYLWNLQDDTFYIDHDPGLGVAMMATYNDKIYNTTEGKDWINHLMVDIREAPDHNLLYYYNQGTHDSTLKCKTWDTLLNSCEGCPYRNKIKNPKQLLSLSTIEKEKIDDIAIDSLENIRANVFPKIDKQIDDILANNSSADILVDAAIGAGKSRWLDSLAVRLAQKGFKLCLSCHSADVALEHKAEIERLGGRAFVMFSYNTIFEKFDNGITCPYSEDIKDLIDLGVETSYFKNKYCKSCPFYDDCNYPRQYILAQEDKYPIIIIQHAHLSSKEVVRQIFKKQFDVLLIDEEFSSFLTTELKPLDKEIEIIKNSNLKWSNELSSWLGGATSPSSSIKAAREDLKPLREAFKIANIPYRVDDFIRFYNDQQLMTSTGIMQFNPLPNVRIRIITDATPTIEELEIILNNKHIFKLGGEVLCDPLVYHPDNKVYQILDGRCSKTSLLKNEELWYYLEDACDSMRNEYKNLLGLFTVFQESEQDVLDFICRNYKDIVPRIQVNHMAVGSNEWARFNVQFLFASPYLNTETLLKETYKLKFIKNYWNRLEDIPLINNPYPSDIPNNTYLLNHKESITRIHRDGVYQYPQFQVHTPDPTSYEYLVYKRLVGKRQQAIRIRHGANKPFIVKIYDLTPLPSMVVTDSFTKLDVLTRLQIEE